MPPSSRFEVGSNSGIVLDLVSEATVFFIRFDKLETNDLDLVDFLGVGSHYVDFHGFRVPKECVSRLEAVYTSRGDFM